MSRRQSRGPAQREVVGVNPVRELLRAGRAVREVLVDRDRSRTDAVTDIVRLAEEHDVPVRQVDRSDIDEWAAGLVHQGVVAIAPPFPYLGMTELLERAVSAPTPALLVALDGVTDPHNLGSIARSAEAVGAHGLIIPSRRAAHVTAVAEKTAAGALAHLAVARVTNLVRALEEARSSGCWILGLDADTDTALADSNLLDEPLVLVIGAEGSGLAHLSQVQCDQLVKLPMRGRVGSLNASVAAGVALYEVDRHRHR